MRGTPATTWAGLSGQGACPAPWNTHTHGQARGGRCSATRSRPFWDGKTVRYINWCMVIFYWTANSGVCKRRVLGGRRLRQRPEGGAAVGAGRDKQRRGGAPAGLDDLVHVPGHRHGRHGRRRLGGAPERHHCRDTVVGTRSEGEGVNAARGAKGKPRGPYLESSHWPSGDTSSDRHSLECVAYSCVICRYGVGGRAGSVARKKRGGRLPPPPPPSCHCARAHLAGDRVKDHDLPALVAHTDGARRVVAGKRHRRRRVLRLEPQRACKPPATAAKRVGMPGIGGAGKRAALLVPAPYLGSRGRRRGCGGPRGGRCRRWRPRRAARRPAAPAPRRRPWP